MIELLMVIIILSMIALIALPQVVDLKKDAQAASALSFISNLRSSIINKKTQIVLQCHQSADTWPRLDAILMNDITEGGSPLASCTPSEVPNTQERKFLDTGVTPLPVNPYNNRSDMKITSCSDLCSCPDEAGYLYNPNTGLIGHKLISDECSQRAR